MCTFRGDMTLFRSDRVKQRGFERPSGPMSLFWTVNDRLEAVINARFR